ncbi:hypothetical protein [Subtercola sp. YIM 133946]|uniref:hypothetical protein n=1 Tax=Subtercola sp. YIM 133946 TaxID=3118909 RepID=UPI002F94092C
MQMYSHYRTGRTLQAVSDVVAVAVVALSVWAGATVAGVLLGLARIGGSLASSGAGFQSTMTDAARNLGGIPLIGPSASAPFVVASSAGSMLQATGENAQSLVGSIAVVTGVLVAAVPIALVAWLWLRRRVAFVREAAETRMLAGTPAGHELLALRTMLTAEPAALLRVASNPVAEWRRSNPAVIRELAVAELRRAGVRPESIGR